MPLKNGQVLFVADTLTTRGLYLGADCLMQTKLRSKTSRNRA